jgi:hypothetical protein
MRSLIAIPAIAMIAAMLFEYFASFLLSQRVKREP